MAIWGETNLSVLDIFVNVIKGIFEQKPNGLTEAGLAQIASIEETKANKDTPKQKAANNNQSSHSSQYTEERTLSPEMQTMADAFKRLTGKEVFGNHTLKLALQTLQQVGASTSEAGQDDQWFKGRVQEGETPEMKPAMHTEPGENGFVGDLGRGNRESNEFKANSTKESKTKTKEFVDLLVKIGVEREVAIKIMLQVKEALMMQELEKNRDGGRSFTRETTARNGASPLRPTAPNGTNWTSFVSQQNAELAY